MNIKPNNIIKSETLNINLSKKSKEYITNKAISKKCSRSELIVDCVYSSHERRTKRDRECIKNAVVKQNLINIIYRRSSCVDGVYSDYMQELIRVEGLAWLR